jgi:hypothetical protein
MFFLKINFPLIFTYSAPLSLMLPDDFFLGGQFCDIAKLAIIYNKNI